MPAGGRPVLAAVRLAHEDGAVQLSCGGDPAVLPASFRLLLAANPCPCGGGRPGCQCSPAAIDRYLGRLTADRKAGLVVVNMGA